MKLCENLEVEEGCKRNGTSRKCVRTEKEKTINELVCYQIVCKVKKKRNKKEKKKRKTVNEMARHQTV